MIQLIDFKLNEVLVKSGKTGRLGLPNADQVDALRLHFC